MQNEWTPKAVTKMLLRLGSFATIVYLVVTGVGTNDIIAIGGVLGSMTASFIPDDEAS